MLENEKINSFIFNFISKKPLTSIQTSINISALNGKSDINRRKTPRIEKNIQLIIIAAMIIYSIICYKKKIFII